MRRPRLAERPRPAPAPPMKPHKDEDIAAFLRASGDGNIAEMEVFLQTGMDINAKDNAGLTALHIASIMGKMHSVNKRRKLSMLKTAINSARNRSMSRA